MNKIIVTIKNEYNQMLDVEIPTDQPMESLKKDIAEAINGSNSSMRIEADCMDLYSERLNRVFFPGDTCNSTGVWNGDVLVFQGRKQ